MTVEYGLQNMKMHIQWAESCIRRLQEDADWSWRLISASAARLKDRKGVRGLWRFWQSMEALRAAAAIPGSWPGAFWKGWERGWQGKGLRAQRPRSQDGWTEETGIEIEEIQVNRLEIRPCLGCFSCWDKTPGKCCIQDDMREVIQKLLWADVTVWSFPLYYYLTGSCSLPRFCYHYTPYGYLIVYILYPLWVFVNV
jgi:hypothetical protein